MVGVEVNKLSLGLNLKEWKEQTVEGGGARQVVAY